MTIITTTLIVMGCTSSSPEKMMASAKDYLEKDDPAAAIIQIKNVLNKNPDSPEARLLLGRALLDSGDPVAAASHATARPCLDGTRQGKKSYR